MYQWILDGPKNNPCFYLELADLDSRIESTICNCIDTNRNPHESPGCVSIRVLRMLSGEAREAREVSVFALNNSNSPPQYKAIPSPNTPPPLDSSVSKHGGTLG